MGAIETLSTGSGSQREAVHDSTLGYTSPSSRRWASTFPRRPRYSISAVVPAAL